MDRVRGTGIAVGARKLIIESQGSQLGYREMVLGLQGSYVGLQGSIAVKLIYGS